jgi:hypothetical protein
LPLVVVITELGKATGRMLPENAAALVGAGILSVLLFPLIALSLRAPARTGAARTAEPVGASTPAPCGDESAGPESDAI